MHGDLFNGHCLDVEGDRMLGAAWDRRFCEIAARHGKMFTAHQMGHKASAVALRRSNGAWARTILPDITIWSAPGEHHENKHKTATSSGQYGLEDYRLASLVQFAETTQQRVYYTIHDWARLGKHSPVNDERDWLTCDVAVLWRATNDGSADARRFNSWVGGKMQMVPGWFWPTRLWVPLTEIWQRKRGGYDPCLDTPIEISP